MHCSGNQTPGRRVAVHYATAAPRKLHSNKIKYQDHQCNTQVSDLLILWGDILILCLPQHASLLIGPVTVLCIISCNVPKKVGCLIIDGSVKNKQ